MMFFIASPYRGGTNIVLIQFENGNHTQNQQNLKIQNPK